VSTSPVLTPSVHQVSVLKSDIQAPGGATQNVVTFHVSESGEAVVQEAYEEAGAVETAELAQIAVETYDGGGDFSVVEQAAEEVAEEVHSPDPGYR